MQRFVAVVHLVLGLNVKRDKKNSARLNKPTKQYTELYFLDCDSYHIARFLPKHSRTDSEYYD